MAVGHYKKMLKAARGDDPKYMLLLVMGNMGLRVSEAVQLSRPDFDRLSGNPPACTPRSLKKKDRGARKLIYVHPRIAGRLRRYLRSMDRGQDRLFPGNARGGHLSARQAQRWFKGLVRACKFVQDYSTHSLRHMYASLVAEKTGNMAFVRDQLGHATIQGIGVTSQYIHISPEKARELIKQVGYIL